MSVGSADGGRARARRRASVGTQHDSFPSDSSAISLSGADQSFGSAVAADEAVETMGARRRAGGAHPLAVVIVQWRGAVTQVRPPLPWQPQSLIFSSLHSIDTAD